jgi:hypothetical protein
MEKVFILPLDTFPSETDKVIWINYPELPSHDFRWISLDRLAGFVPKDRTAYVSVVQAIVQNDTKISPKSNQVYF